jgi:phosphotriesterase-related protein
VTRGSADRRVEEGQPHGISTFRGEVDPGALGLTLIHEHLFVRDPELERNVPGLEWDESQAIERAVRGLTSLYALGVRTVVDLTVLGLGRDVHLVQSVAERVPLHIIAATGYYAADALSLYFAFRGPGRLIDGPEPLVDLFVRDIEEGIAGSTVRAAMIKVMTGEAGMNPAVERIMTAAAMAHLQTGVPITTHSVPSLGNGLHQQAFLLDHGVAPTRIIIGHSGDTDDLAYLRAIMDNGSTIGMDRFGMEHVLSDERRMDTVVKLVGLGYADRMIMSHDAAVYSFVTPPSWRGLHAPHWDMEHLLRRILPALLERGVSQEDLDRILITNPRQLLVPGRG